MELAIFIYNQSYTAFEFHTFDPKSFMVEELLT